MTFPIVMLAAAAAAGDGPPAYAPLLYWFAADGSGNSKLYADTAGASPAVASGPVARIDGDTGGTFLQNTAGNRPTRTADAKGIVFNGSTSLRMSSGALLSSMSSAQNFTIMMAGRYTSGTGWALSLESASGCFRGIGWSSGNKGRMAEFDLTGTGDAQTSNLATADRNVLIGRVGDLSTLSANVKIDTSGADASVSYNDGLPDESYNRARLAGQSTNDSGSNKPTFTLHELAIYSAMLDDTQVGQLITYAKARWSLP